MVSPKFDLFVSYADADRWWVAGYLLDALERVGIGCHTEEAFRLGVPRIDEFERAIKESNRTLLVLSEAYLANESARLVERLAQYYGHDSHTWPVIPLKLSPVENLHPSLAMLTSLDATDSYNWQSVIARLCEDLKKPAPQVSPRRTCPYPGMRAFHMDEGEEFPFFGRERESRELVEKHLRMHPFLAIIGPSGTGKSSLVFAGLVPDLMESSLFGSGSWVLVSLRPGETPLRNLRGALSNDLAAPAEAVKSTLEAARKRGQADAERVLLIVDQFEEVFAARDGDSAKDFTKFQQLLLELADAENCFVVLTVRADFYGDLMESPIIWPEIQAHRYELSPLGQSGLREAIVRPAEHVGIFLEPALVERLLADAGNEPGVLPFLQETLMLLWSRLERNCLPLSAYREMVEDARKSESGAMHCFRSGIEVAMAMRADHAIRELKSEPERLIARRTFLRLVQFGEGRSDTRRQQTLAQLRVADDDIKVFNTTLQHLVSARLLTTSAEGEQADDRVSIDIAHEALFSGWPTLSTWIAQRREAEQTRRWLSDQAKKWLDRQQIGEEGGLLDEVELHEATRWLEKHGAIVGRDTDIEKLIDRSRDYVEKQKEHDKRIQANLVDSLEKERRSAYFANIALAERYWHGIQVDRAKESLQLCHESQRGWEWSYLTHLCNSELSVPQIGEPIISCTFTPDGTQMACGVANGRVLITEVCNGKILDELRTNLESIRRLEFDPTGTGIAIVLGERGDGLQLWSLDRRELIKELAPTELPIHELAFSPDGRLIAGVDGSHVTLWDAMSQSVRFRFEHSRCHGLAFSPNGQWIAAVARSPNFVDDGRVGLVKFWDVETGNEVLSFTGDELRQIVFTADSHTLVAASENALVGFSSETGECSFYFRAHIEQINAIAVSSDGLRIATAGVDRQILIWEIHRIEERLPSASYIGHTDSVQSLEFSPDCERLMSMGAQGTVKVWDVTSEQQSITHHFGLEANSFTSPAGGGGTTNMLAVPTAISSDGNQYASASITLVIRDTHTARRIVHLDREIDPYSKITFSPNGERIVVYVSSSLSRTGIGLVRLIESKTGRETCVIRAHEKPVRSAAISSDGIWLATCAGDVNGDDSSREPVMIWDVTTQALVRTCDIAGVVFNCIRFSPTGHFLAAASSDQVVVWDVRTGVEIRRVKYSGANIDCMEFSRDGKLLAIAYSGPRIEIAIWDLERDRELTILRGHEASANTLAFSVDGSRIATGSNDKTVRLWALQDGHELLTLRGHSERVCSVTFSQSDDAILSASSDGTLKIWPIVRNWGGDADDSFSGVRSRAPAWHLGRAESSLRRDYSKAAIAHLSWSACFDVRDWRFLSHRGDLYGKLKMWAEAERDFCLAGQQPNSPPWIWHNLALLLVHKKDLNAYHALCGNLVRDYLSNHSNEVRLAVVRTCCLAPNGNGKNLATLGGKNWWTKVMEFVERAGSGQNASDRQFNVYGAALCREGRFDAAIRQLENTDGTYLWDLWQKLFLSIAYANAGRKRKAWKIVSEVDQVLNPRENEPRSMYSWEHRLELDNLLREACDALH